MPNRTVYIRKEDIEKWKALQDKSEKISKLLNERVEHSYKVIVEPSGLAEPVVMTLPMPPNKQTVDTNTISYKVPSKCLTCGLYACECK